MFQVDGFLDLENFDNHDDQQMQGGAPFDS